MYGCETFMVGGYRLYSDNRERDDNHRIQKLCSWRNVIPAYRTTFIVNQTILRCIQGAEEKLGDTGRKVRGG